MVDHMSAEELLAAPAKDKGGRPRGPADRELALSLVFEVRARRFDASKKGKALLELAARFCSRLPDAKSTQRFFLDEC